MIKKISILILAIILFSLSSCEKQEEQMENRDKFVGSWNVVENTASKSANSRDIDMAYIANITRSETFPDETYIYNFFNVSDEYYIPAYVKEKDIIIDKITLRDYTVRGSGKLSDNEKAISWTYWVEGPYDDQEVKYTATYTLR